MKRELLLLSALLIVAAGIHTAAADNTISIRPDTTCVGTDELFTIQIFADSVSSPFDGYEALIEFDPLALELHAITEEPLLPDLCNNTWWYHSETDSTAFISHVALCGGNTIDGPGLLSSITFRTLSLLTTTHIDFVYIELYQAGEIVPVAEINNSVVVVRENCASACCLSDASCLVLDEESCLLAGGTWFVSQITCEPNPCLFMAVPEMAPLDQNRFGLEIHPNPFQNQAKIQFTLLETGTTKLGIYDLAGRVIWSKQAAGSDRGSTSIVWDGRGNSGRAVNSGIYFCVLSFNGQTQMRPIMIYR